MQSHYWVKGKKKNELEDSTSSKINITRNGFWLHGNVQVTYTMCYVHKINHIVQQNWVRIV